MPKISTKGIRARKRLFHNELISVYETALPLREITFWPENNRTQFTFELLEREQGRELKEIPLDEITRFVASKPQHKLDALAASIRKNGVQVHLIVLDDGTLLDGNRRFFACQLLRIRAAEQDRRVPAVLKRIPVFIIKSKDITPSLRLKILAEANFVEDLKVPWPLDAKARAVKSFYDECRKRRMDHEQAIAEIREVFGISSQRAQDYLDTMIFADEFVNGADNRDERYNRRQVVEGAFVYFWEFRNKATKGAAKLDSEKEFPEVKEMFFTLMARPEGFANIKEIEPFIRARRDRTAWPMLVQSEGTRLPQVVALMNEKRALRKSEDKLQLFYSWLSEVKSQDLNDTAFNLIKDIVAIAEQILGTRRKG